MALRRLAEHQPDSFVFTPENAAWCQEQMQKYPPGRQASAVIPILWRAQEQEGWVTRPMIEEVGRILGMPFMRVLEVAQRCLPSVDPHVDLAATPSVASVGSAARDMRFTSEARRAIAASTRGDPDLHAVEKHRVDSRMADGRPVGRVVKSARVAPMLEVAERIDPVRGAFPWVAAPDFEQQSLKIADEFGVRGARPVPCAAGPPLG